MGLLDIDLCGPSVPTLLALKDKSVHQASEGYAPALTKCLGHGTVLAGILMLAAHAE